MSHFWFLFSFLFMAHRYEGNDGTKSNHTRLFVSMLFKNTLDLFTFHRTEKVGGSAVSLHTASINCQVLSISHKILPIRSLS